MSINRFDQIAGYGVLRVAQAFGGTLHDRTHLGPCPACNETRRSRSDRRQGPVFVTADKTWKCGICDASGDAAAWIAVKLTGAVPGKGDPRWRDILAQAAAAGFCDAPEGHPDPLPPRAPPPPPAPPAPPERPPQAEIDALLRVARPSEHDPEVIAWLESRLGPAPARMRRVQEVVAALPRAASRLPGWAARWPDSGYRAIFRCFDADGDVCSVKARRLHAADGPKSMPPKGFEVRGLCFANPTAEDMLRGADAPSQLVIVEGEPAFLAWCAAAPAGAAVIGIFNGSWTPEHAAKVPPEAAVLISTDHGDAKGTGDGYARTIAATMPDRLIRRWRWEADPTCQPDGVVFAHGLESLRWSDSYEWQRPALRVIDGGSEDEDDAPAPEPPAPVGDGAEGLRQLKILASVLADLTEAKPGDRQAAIKDFCGRLDDIGAAYLDHKAEVKVEIAQIGTIPKCSGLAQTLTGAMRAAGESVKARRQAAIAAWRSALSAHARDVPRAPLPTVIDGGAGEPPPGGADSGAPPEEPDYDAFVPPGYRVDDSGVWKVAEGDDGEEVTRVALAPIYAVGIAIDTHTRAHAIRLRWRDGKRWIVRSFPADTLASARSIAGIAATDGFPVSSVTASGVVAYLEAARIFIREGGAGAEVSRIFGWQEGEGEDPVGFLIGRALYGPGGEIPAAEAPLTFDPQNDNNAARLARAYHAAGTWAGWCKLIEDATPYPKVTLGVLASLAAPLLREIPTQKNFIVDFAGDTSGGKTTMLRVCASAWGRPDDGGHGVIHTWDLTKTYLERVIEVQTDLPLLIDDTARADPAALVKIIYLISQGSGRGKAAGGGASTQSLATWRTVAVSTGETPITAYTKAGGAAARVLSLWGSPLEGATDGAALATRLSTAAMQHYGHAGPRLVAWLQRRDNRARVAAWYAEDLARLNNRAGSKVEARAGGYVALLSVARRVLFEIGGPDVGEAPLRLALQATGDAAESADRAYQALCDIYEWATANSAAFYGRHNKTDGLSRPREWLGVWATEAVTSRPYVLGVICKAMNAKLDDLGYAREAILRTWADRDWIARDPEGKRQIVARVDGTPSRVIGLTAKAIATIYTPAQTDQGAPVEG